MNTSPDTYHYSTNHQPSKVGRVAKRAGKIVGFATGLALTGAGALGAIQPQETIAGNAAAVPAIERVGDPTEYVESPERNNSIAETFQKVSDRVLERAKKEDDASASTNYEQSQGQPGMITQTITRNGQKYVFRLGVDKVNGPDKYVLDDDNKVLIVQTFDKTDGITINRYSYLAQPNRVHGARTPWTTEASDHAIQPQEQLKEVNPEAIDRYGMSYGQALAADQLAMDSALYLADQAGI